MTGAEFGELVEWVWDRWGRSDEVWSAPERFQADFDGFDAEDVWAAVFAVGTGQWAPRPAVLAAAAREQMRSRLRPERHLGLPSPKGASWSEWCMEKFGEVRRIDDVVRDRHAEMEGLFVEELEAWLPSESGQIEDGMRPKVGCRAPGCDVHGVPS